MIDLLVQVTTSNKITPGDHVLQVMNERSDDFLYYKPSTPIGALEASTVHIMPKHRVNDSIVRKVPMKMVNQPFETTFRLQVRLPRNQLYVARVTPRMSISQVLQLVCKDRNLDEDKFEIRHPDNLDERLRPNYTLADYQLTEVSLVSVSKSNPNSRSVSTSDIFRFQQEAEILAREAVVAKKHLGRKSSKTRSSAGESSVSSGSLGDQGDRSLSPLVNSRSELHLNHVGRSGSSSIMPEPPSRPRKKKAPLPPGKSRQLPTTPGDGELSLAALHRSGLIDSPTKSISMSNLTQSGINGDYPSASNLSTVSAGSVLSLNSTTSGRMKRRAPAPPKKLSPVPPVVPIPEETPSLIYKEEAVVEPKTVVEPKIMVESKPKVQSSVPEPAPRTLGIVKQETVEERVEDVVPPPPASPSPDAPEYQAKDIGPQESVEEFLEETAPEDPKPNGPQLQRQDRFEQSIESPMEGLSREDIEKAMARREKEQRRKERRERRERRAKDSEQVADTPPLTPLEVAPSSVSAEMKEIPMESPLTSTPKIEKVSTFTEAGVHESRVQAEPSPKSTSTMDENATKMSEPASKQPEPETKSSLDPVVTDTPPIVDEEPIEPTLRASSSTVDLASGMKNFKISAYSEFRPVARKSPNILSKIQMFDNYECPEGSSPSLPTHFPKPIQTFRQKQASSHLATHQSNLKDQSTISNVTSIKKHKHSTNLLPKPFISRAQTPSSSASKYMQSVPSPSSVYEVTIPTISISPPPEVIEKPAVQPQSRKSSTSTEEAEALRELDSIVKQFELMEQQNRAPVTPPNHGKWNEPPLTSQSWNKSERQTNQKIFLEQKQPTLIQGQAMDIMDINPDPMIQQSELSIRELRVKMEKEVEKAKHESHMDMSPFSLIRGQVQKTKQIEAFACQVHERNVSFLEQLELEHGSHNPGKGKKSLKTMAMGESSYNWEGILGEQESNENIDLSRLSKTPTTLNDLASNSDKILGSSLKPIGEEGILKTNYDSSGSLKGKRSSSPKSAKSVSFEEHQKWNKFLKDIGDFSIEIDDENEIIL
ncbi:hypothetical protein TCAL_12620 [Tigriopus californicus]|uniref:RBD domain-containing protein n=1 Tax=Tigriopus californicus TaxID=6832 RepID=A0A553PN51_TIGCA|nr:hypothetical protein TCAL_12620 [Tigriopus californicus]|eukprot:TCALIF_12620-PA protein Name:"Similar to Cobll1 Cordon-bleu protein-like 1 (Mus musculus)" AED:0.30 eAED:0.30 QI:9/1/0.83/1/1/1/6/0/1048